MFGCWNIQEIPNKIDFLPEELMKAEIYLTIFSETKQKGKREEETDKYLRS